MLAKFLLAAGLTVIGVTAQSGENPCLVLSGGPSSKTKDKMADYIKKNYIKGQIEPDGCGFLENTGSTWQECTEAICLLCDGAWMSVRNYASDVAGYTLSNDELDDALSQIKDGWNECVVAIDMTGAYLQVGFSTEDSLDKKELEGCQKC